METITRHATDCNRAFNRRDPRCPRCEELASGAAPRKGWGQPRFGGRATSPQHHDCKAVGCGPVWTFGDW